MYSRIRDISRSRKPSEIYFEGGLGSQIFSAGKYYYALTQPGAEWVVPNCDYFTNPKVESNHSGLQFWPFKLKRYGIELEDLVDKSRNWIKPSGSVSQEIHHLRNADAFNWLRLNRERFPIGEEVFKENCARFEIPEQYNLIHIRRGDYVKIHSLLIEHESYLHLVRKIHRILHGTSVIISDDNLTEEEKQTYRSALGGRVIFLSESLLPADEAHDLMRNSDILITANSTFSYSAAVLSSSARIIFSPLDHASKGESTNTFTGLGKWYIHD